VGNNESVAAGLRTARFLLWWPGGVSGECWVRGGLAAGLCTGRSPL
jgi:hypothetical protein